MQLRHKTKRSWTNPRRARALPFLGKGDDVTSREPIPDMWEHGFVTIAKIFGRTWSYLATYILGYWQELTLSKRTAIDGERSTVPPAGRRDSGDREWGFGHVPPLVTLIAAVGPLTGWVPWNTNWLFDGILFAAASMSALTWILLFVKGRFHLLASVALAVVATLTFLFAVFAVEGVADNIYVALLCLSSTCIWVLQYRIHDGRVRLRIRLGSHLAYYFVLLWANTLLLILLALFSVDVVTQSILQAKPVTPFIADILNEPELAIGTTTQYETTGAPDQVSDRSLDAPSLSNEQRHSLKWVYAAFLLLGWLVQLPLGMALPYYYIYIMQRVNQDLRVALIERWHLLSMRYHSNHRVGDSVYRLYQDSAQVTAVIGEIIRALQVIITYGTGLTFSFCDGPDSQSAGTDGYFGRSCMGLLVFASHAK